MDWLALLGTESITLRAWAILTIGGAGFLWFMAYGRRKILQDLEILERIGPLDGQGQAALAIRSSIKIWVKTVYGWPKFLPLGFGLLAGALVYTSGSLLALAWQSRSFELALFGSLSGFEAMLFGAIAVASGRFGQSRQARALEAWQA